MSPLLQVFAVSLIPWPTVHLPSIHACISVLRCPGLLFSVAHGSSHIQCIHVYTYTICISRVICMWRLLRMSTWYVLCLYDVQIVGAGCLLRQTASSAKLLSVCVFPARRINSACLVGDSVWMNELGKKQLFFRISTSKMPDSQS